MTAAQLLTAGDSAQSTSYSAYVNNVDATGDWSSSPSLSGTWISHSCEGAELGEVVG